VRVVGWAQSVVADHRFNAFIIGVILINAVLVGLETSEALVAQFGDVFLVLNIAIAVIFVIEIALRMATYWPRPWAFFRDPWNVFDFVIVGLSILPVGGRFATVARLARLLRVLRVVSVMPELRLIVGTMLRSVGSMVGVIVLLALVVYTYAVIGVYLFGAYDPQNWGSLGAAVWTLFEALTLEGWLELQAAVTDEVPLSWIYFGSYILIAVFIVVNLFIAVILNNLERVKVEQAAEDMATESAPEIEDDLLRRVATIRAELAELELRLKAQADAGLGVAAADR
jgi:voltage-gated sodium channel